MVGSHGHDVKRTAFAQQGIDFVILFEAKFHVLDINGHRPVLREPPSDTTSGGAQAVQHMVLEPKIPGDPLVTVGQVNVVTKTGKLRTFECILGMHAMRYRDRPFLVDAGQYQKFFDKVLEFMRRQGMQVQIETRPPEMRSSRPPAVSSGANVLIWMLLAAVLVGSVVAGYLAYTGRLSL